MNRGDDDVDGVPIDDVDGFPIKDEDKDDLDGVPIANTPLIKSAAISALLGYDDDGSDEDIDGAPLDDDVDGFPLKDTSLNYDNGPAPGFVSSKWERVSPKRVEAEAVTTSKWEIVEQNQSEEEVADGSNDNTPVYDRSGGHTQNSLDEDDLDGVPLIYADYKRKKRDS